MPTWGTQRNPAHFIEIPDPSYSDPGGTTKMKRPAAGTTLLVRNAQTLADLTPITTDAYGFWSYTLDDATITEILVSPDGGVTWVGPLTSAESQTAAVTSGSQAAEALAVATNADQKADQALTQSATGSGESTYEWLYETAPGSYPTPTQTAKPRKFVGQVRPTLAQGRRDRDEWRNVVWVSS